MFNCREKFFLIYHQIVLRLILTTSLLLRTFQHLEVTTEEVGEAEEETDSISL